MHLRKQGNSSSSGKYTIVTILTRNPNIVTFFQCKCPTICVAWKKTDLGKLSPAHDSIYPFTVALNARYNYYCHISVECIISVWMIENKTSILFNEDEDEDCNWSSHYKCTDHSNNSLESIKTEIHKKINLLSMVSSIVVKFKTTYYWKLTWIMIVWLC